MPSMAPIPIRPVKKVVDDGVYSGGVLVTNEGCGTFVLLTCPAIRREGA